MVKFEITNEKNNKEYIQFSYLIDIAILIHSGYLIKTFFKEERK